MTSPGRLGAALLLAVVQTAPAASAEPFDPEDTSRNPRAENHGAGGVAVLFPAGIVGGWAEGRPHWSVALGGGAGVFVWDPPEGTAAVASFWVDVALLPVPFLVTPELAFGLVRVVGDGADSLADDRAWTFIDGDRHRGTVYGRVGARIDGVANWTASIGVGLLPPASLAGPPLVLPSVRFGGRF